MKIKPTQKVALEEIAFNRWDCGIVLPTGYTKSLIYQLLPLVCDHLSAENFTESKFLWCLLLMHLEDQLHKLKKIGLNCTSLHICGSEVDGCIGRTKDRKIPHHFCSP